ncbi:MAG: gamma-glutamyltransferase [Alphaproteobacteria bacterium]|nr:gamma-glutamyltransferase [Alphaproteobacteria bacterium]
MDAAIAASAVLAVTIPHMNGLGGDAFALWYDSRRDKVWAINGSGVAPRAATLERYRSEGLKQIPIRGPYSISVPGLVHAWGAALARFGTKPLRTLLESAISFANGGPIGRQFADYCNSDLFAAQCRDHPCLATQYGPPGGRRAGDLLRQTALARTLTALAEAGAAALYGGSIGQALVADARLQGALLTIDDLACHETRFQEPLSLRWREGRLFACPPNTQGMVLLLLLGLLEEASVPAGAAGFPAAFIRAKQIAFCERDRLLGDPQSAAVPADLLETRRLRALWSTEMSTPRSVLRAGTGDTTCLVAMDADGNSVSWIQSLYDEFGSQVCSLKTGIVLQNRLCLASLTSDLPSTLRPGYRPPHTLCPTVFLGGNGRHVVLATPGGHGQGQTLAQVLVNLMDRDLDIQAAIEAPRFCQEHNDGILYESRIADSVRESLRTVGMPLRDAGSWSRDAGLTNALGAAVGIDCAADGLRKGGADPRRDCYVAVE